MKSTDSCTTVRVPSNMRHVQTTLTPLNVFLSKNCIKFKIVDTCVTNLTKIHRLPYASRLVALSPVEALHPSLTLPGPRHPHTPLQGPRDSAIWQAAQARHWTSPPGIIVVLKYKKFVKTGIVQLPSSVSTVALLTSPPFFGAFSKLRKALISFYMYLCPSVRLSVWNNSVPTRQIFMKFYTWVFFENLLRNFKLHSNLTRITCTVYEYQYIFLIISSSFFFLEKENFQNNFVQKINP